MVQAGTLLALLAAAAAVRAGDPGFEEPTEQTATTATTVPPPSLPPRIYSQVCARRGRAVSKHMHTRNSRPRIMMMMMTRMRSMLIYYTQV